MAREAQTYSSATLLYPQVGSCAVSHGRDLGTGTIERSSFCDYLDEKSDTFMSDIHNRMPLTLTTSVWGDWLDPDMDDVGALKHLIMRQSTEAFDVHQVDPKVGNPQHDRPENILPVPTDTLW